MRKQRIYKGSSKENWHNPEKKAKLHLLRQSDKCALCGEKILTMHEATIDHIVPLSLGGLDNIKNMQLAHSKCNQKKGNTYAPTTSNHQSYLGHRRPTSIA